jgi:hypothetical protein
MSGPNTADVTAVVEHTAAAYPERAADVLGGLLIRAPG